jgi:hypothetical protein
MSPTLRNPLETTGLRKLPQAENVTLEKNNYNRKGGTRNNIQVFKQVGCLFLNTRKNEAWFAFHPESKIT